MTNLTETDRDSMERVIVGRGSSHKVTLEVDKTSSVIQWEFVSSEYDIAFGVYHKREEGKGKKIKIEMVMCKNGGGRKRVWGEREYFDYGNKGMFVGSSYSDCLCSNILPAI